jgi:ubiquitin carboxyl-terminal hydrolase 14
MLIKIVVISFQDVKFTMSVDMYDLCTPELQAKLQPARDKFKELEDKIAEEMIQVYIQQEVYIV